jgi:hypothetical protein
MLVVVVALGGARQGSEAAVHGRRLGEGWMAAAQPRRAAEMCGLRGVIGGGRVGDFKEAGRGREE